MNPWLMSAVMVVAWSVFALQMMIKIGALKKMAPESRMDQIPRRIGLLFKIGIGQEKLVGRSRERMPGIMHALIFWGAMLIGIREVTLMGEGFVHGFQEYLPLLGSNYLSGFLFIYLYNIAELVVLLMILVALYRRFVPRPDRLDLNWEGVYVLLFIAGIMLTDLLFDAARFNLIDEWQYSLHQFEHPVYGQERSWAPVASALAGLLVGLGETSNSFFYHFGFWGHIATMLVFVNILINTKQFHEITALPNVFLGSLDYPHARQKWIDLEDEKAWEEGKIGINSLEQLTWKQGLDLYSCTECGRCYDVCPTYVTGKPLTQKWVNQSLLRHLREEEGNIYRTGTTSGEKSLVGDVIHPETLWACTTCRACEDACPVSIEHVPRILGMRQGQTMMEEAYPPEISSAYKGLERNFNPWGVGFDQRADWAAELDIPLMSETSAEDIDVLMWTGCAGSFDSRNQKVARATAELMKKAGVRFAILGSEEKCTGDLARRSGNEMLFQMLASENVETLNGYGVKKIVTQCPHCLNALKNEYPDLGGNYEVLHHSQFLKKLREEEKLPQGKNDRNVTYHDPCYLGRYNQEYDSPREIISESASSVTEMQRHRNESFCCGAGGARMWMEENLGTRINEERVRQAEETGADTLATGCPFCMTMLSDGIAASGNSEKLETRDVAELMLESIKT